MYNVFKYMDTEQEEKYTDFAKGIIGIDDWGTVIRWYLHFHFFLFVVYWQIVYCAIFRRVFIDERNYIGGGEGDEVLDIPVLHTLSEAQTAPLFRIIPQIPASPLALK